MIKNTTASQTKTLFFSVLTALMVISGEIKILSHLRYTILPLCFIIFLKDKRLKSTFNPISKLVLFFAVVGTFSMFYSFTTNNYLRGQNFFGFKEIILIIIPMVTVNFLNNSKSFNFQTFVKTNLIVYCIFQISIIILDPPDSGINFLDFILNGSLSEFEGSITFIIGFIGLFYFLKRDYKIFFFVIFLLLFNGKRVVFFGLLFSALMDFIIKNSFLKNHFRKVLLFAYALILLFMILFADGYFNDYFIKTFGVSIDNFTKGRYYLINSTFKKLDAYSYLFGNGAGFSTRYLDLMRINQNTKLLHSDILKIFIEYGIFGTLTLVYLFFKKIIVLESFAYGLFFIVVSLTDNIIMYNHVMFYFYVFVSSFFYISNTKVKNLRTAY